MKHKLTILIFLFVSLLSLNYVTAQKEISTIRINQKIIIDGFLDESVWQESSIASDFTNFQPIAGIIPKQQTEVRIIYDNNAIYIGAFMQEVSRDSIMVEMAARDDIGNTDFFGFLVDPYASGLNGYEFIVQSTGVQFDAILPEEGDDDESWDSVWESEVRLTENGWYAEMKIPYSAIRFPKKEIQNWKINFIRKQARSGEKSLWAPFDPELNGFTRQFGILNGLSGIKSPLRLSFTPYLTGYYNNISEKNQPSSNTYSYNGGMDLKYGINDAFTIDLTLIPDFGQVKSDEQELNLGPFEIRYDENRPFFTEGLELFEKGGLFYSRRIGATPLGHSDIPDKIEEDEIIIENPIASKLYNATKFSGRTVSGLGIGIFNAVSGESNAIIEKNITKTTRKIQTAPLSNYNVIVLDQNLKNNSSVSLINTSVIRAGNSFYDANVTGTEFTIKNKAQSFSISGDAALSQKYYSHKKNELGHSYAISLNKIGGRFTYALSYDEVSNKYNPNDLGYLSFNNERSFSINTNYSILKKWGPVDRGNIWANVNYNRLYKPNVYTSTHFNAGFWLRTNAQWTVNLWLNIEPDSYDYNEPRETNRFYLSPSYQNIGIWIGSDERKKFKLGTNISISNTDDEGSFYKYISLNPRYRINDRLSLYMSNSYANSKNNVGYVEKSDDDNIIFGRRDQNTIVNSLSASLNINNKMNINFDARHYWSKIYYNAFYELDIHGLLTKTDYNEFNDFSFHFFNIDLTYKWRFAPGSDIIIVWKNNIWGYSDSPQNDYRTTGYFEDLNQLNEFPISNSFSLRVVYYIDFNRIKNL